MVIHGNASHAIGHPRHPWQVLFQQFTQRLALIQTSIAKVGTQLTGVGNDFQ
jgi:hypothetical protein